MASLCPCRQLSRASTTLGGRRGIQQLHAGITQSHPFSTTSPVGQTKYPPESPFWRKLPEPAQSQASEFRQPQIRGHLPVPRTVFPRAEGDRKVQQDYLEQTAPSPTNEASKQPVRPGSAAEFRRLMAESRRQNLKAGLQGLYERKQAKDRRVASASKARQAYNRRAASMPEPEDEMLTRPTTLKSTEETIAVQPDPGRFDRAAIGRERTAARERRLREDRKTAIMELYINASKFIVEEEQLINEIDRTFTEEYWEKLKASNIYHNSNAWDVWGRPPTIQSMLAGMMRTQQQANEITLTEHDRTVQRQKTVAEELTGGKME